MLRSFLLERGECMKRLERFFCLLAVVLMSLSNTSVYLATESTESTEIEEMTPSDIHLEMYYNNRSQMVYDKSAIEGVPLPDIVSEYEDYMILYNSEQSRYELWTYPNGLGVEMYYFDSYGDSGLSFTFDAGTQEFYLENGAWVYKYTMTGDGSYRFARITSGGEFILQTYRFVASSYAQHLIPNSQLAWYCIFPFVSDVYNPDLGYLNNLTYKKLLLSDSDGGLIVNEPGSAKYVFEYGSMSTTGVSLSGNCSVRHFMEIEVHEGVDVGVCDIIRSYGKVKMGEHNAYTHRIEYMYDYLERLYTESEFTGLGWWESNWYHTAVIHYFQILRFNDDGTIEYGNMLRFDPKTHKFTTVSPEGDALTDYSGNVNVSTGQGTTFEDAELNADVNKPLNGYDSSNIAADLESLLAFVGSFPAVLGALLSFLPVEYQTAIFLSIVVAIVLVVWKVARG